VVTVNRVRTGAPDVVRFTDEQTAGFVARVRDAARERAAALDISADDLAEMARIYATTTYSTLSAARLRISPNRHSTIAVKRSHRRLSGRRRRML